MAAGDEGHSLPKEPASTDIQAKFMNGILLIKILRERERVRDVLRPAHGRALRSTDNDEDKQLRTN